MTRGCLTNLLQGCCWDKIRNCWEWLLWSGGSWQGCHKHLIRFARLAPTAPALLPSWALGGCQDMNQHLCLQTIPEDSSASLHGVLMEGGSCHEFPLAGNSRKIRMSSYWGDLYLPVPSLCSSAAFSGGSALQVLFPPVPCSHCHSPFY